MNEAAILRKWQVAKITGRSPSSIRRDVARGEFPKPVQIGPRSIGWRSEDVRAWLNSRAPAKLPPAFPSREA